MKRYAWALGVVLMSGCDQYAGPNCEGLALGTSASELPLNGISEPSAEIFKWAEPLISGNDELRCCALNSYDGKPGEATCARVDCDDVRKRVRVGGLEGRFKNESCGPRQGLSLCSAVVENDKVVGVYARCFD